MKTAFIIVACVCVLFALVSTPLCSASTEADARSAVFDAKERVTSCYIAAAEADRVGANVTDLLSTLDTAGILLSGADLSFQKGDYDSAYNFAVQSKALLDGFEAQANSRKDSAEHDNSVDFWVNMVGSSVGTVGVVVGAVAVWFWLSKRYRQTGQAVENESQRV